MEQYQTQTGARPDLAEIEVNAPEGYIGHILFPRCNSMEKTGDIYYKTVTADAAAQTGRSSGSAPTRTLLTDSTDSFTAAEVIKRYSIDRNEVKQMGGIEAADRLGGKAAKRSVLRAIEDAHAAALFDASSYSSAEDITGNIIFKIRDAVRSVKRYAGETALVLPWGTFEYLIQQTEVTNKLAFNGFNFQNPSQVLSIDESVIRAMLGGLFGIRQVLIGDDDHWSISGQEDQLAVTKLPPADEFSHKLDPVLGKTFHYLPDGEDFYVESEYDGDVKVNNYDAFAWYQVKELNSSAKVVMKLGSLSTTTTT